MEGKKRIRITMEGVLPEPIPIAWYKGTTPLHIESEIKKVCGIDARQRIGLYDVDGDNVVLSDNIPNDSLFHVKLAVVNTPQPAQKVTNNMTLGEMETDHGPSYPSSMTNHFYNDHNVGTSDGNFAVPLTVRRHNPVMGMQPVMQTVAQHPGPIVYYQQQMPPGSARVQVMNSQRSPYKPPMQPQFYQQQQHVQEFYYVNQEGHPIEYSGGPESANMRMYKSNSGQFTSNFVNLQPAQQPGTYLNNVAQARVSPPTRKSDVKKPSQNYNQYPSNKVRRSATNSIIQSPKQSANPEIFNKSIMEDALTEASSITVSERSTKIAQTINTAFKDDDNFHHSSTKASPIPQKQQQFQSFTNVQPHSTYFNKINTSPRHTSQQNNMESLFQREFDASPSYAGNANYHDSRTMRFGSNSNHTSREPSRNESHYREEPMFDDYFNDNYLNNIECQQNTMLRGDLLMDNDFEGYYSG